MSSNKISESEKVNKKILQSRLEIDILKAEYERAIQQGLNLNKNSARFETFEKDLNNECSRNINNVRGSQPLKSPEVKSEVNPKKNNEINCLEVKSDLNLNNETKTSVNRARVRRRLSDELNKEKSPKKCRNYDVEAAREFMKKQKEKRLEQLRLQSKKSDNTNEIRKQKLNELHKKSQQLLVQSARTRSRSRSKENHVENGVKKPTIISEIIFKSPRDSKNSLGVPEQSTRCIKNSGKIKTVTNHKLSCTNHNIPVSIPNLQLFKPKEVEDFNDHINLKKVKAAVVIQSFYRGYKQRREYQKLFKESHAETNEISSKKSSLCFEQEVNSYPHNFISIVKHKLNMAVKSPQKTDVGVQITPNDSLRTRQELKEMIEKSINNSRIDSIINKPHLSSKKIEKSLNNSQIDSVTNKPRSTSKKNGPCASINQNSSKKVTLKSFLYQNCTDLNLENVASLKLKSKLSDHSDSDTSKNIPDLTTESVSVKPKSSSTSTSIKEISKNVKLSAQKSSESIQSLNRLSSKIMKETFSRSEKNHFLKVPSFNENINIPSEISVMKLSSKISDNVLKPMSLNSDYSKRKINDIDVENLKKLKLQRQNENNGSGGRRSRRDSIISSNHSSYSSYFSSMTSDKTDNSPVTKSKSSVETEVKNVSNNVTASEKRTNTLDKSVGENLNVESRNTLKSFSENLPQISDSFITLRTTTPQSSNQESVDTKNSNELSKAISIPSLTVPSVSLQRNDVNEKNTDGAIKETKNISLNVQDNSNKIHLKFEAEVHLLNDFNESLRQYVAVEKSLLHLEKKKNQAAGFETRDTQTSFKSRTLSVSKDNSQSHNVTTNSDIDKHPSLNFSRGSDFHASNLNSFDELNRIISRIGEHSLTLQEKQIVDESMVPLTTIDISQFPNQSAESSKGESFIDVFNRLSGSKENLNNVQSALSLGMFEQLMKDEDLRIENLKTVLKIREKALLDRTKGELAWLEIQRKHFLQTGKVQEASVVKKRQRGLIIKLEHEKHEMQKLKEMQKAASKQRKTKLKEHHDLIKVQLSTSSIPTKLKRFNMKERKSKGPLKVYNYHIQSMQAEMNLSHKSSITEEVVYSSHTESISRITEKDITEADNTKDDGYKIVTSNNLQSNQTEIAKQSLLMREATLHKRKKAVEDLLQWHQKLLEEEKKIEELEMAASNIIQQMPSVNIENKRSKTVFKGSQLNFLLENMTGCHDKKFNDDETYNLSQISLSRLCRRAECVNKKVDNLQKVELSRSNQYVESIESEEHTSKSNTLNNLDTHSEVKSINYDDSKEHSTYTSDFEEVISQNILEEGIKKPESNLSEIMQNISCITDEISELYKLSSIQNKDQANTDKENITEDINTSLIILNDEKLPESNTLNRNRDILLEKPVEDSNSSILIEKENKVTEPLFNELNLELIETTSKDDEHIGSIEENVNKNEIDILQNSLSDSKSLLENIITNLSNLKSTTINSINDEITSEPVQNSKKVTLSSSDLNIDVSTILNERSSRHVDEISTFQESTENDIPSLPNESIIVSEVLPDLSEVKDRNNLSINLDVDLTSVKETDILSENEINSAHKESFETSIKSKELELSNKSNISTKIEVESASIKSFEASIRMEIDNEDVSLPVDDQSNVLTENESQHTEYQSSKDNLGSEVIQDDLSLPQEINSLVMNEVKTSSEEISHKSLEEHTGISVDIEVYINEENSEPSINSEIVTNGISELSNIKEIEGDSDELVSLEQFPSKPNNLAVDNQEININLISESEDSFKEGESSEINTASIPEKSSLNDYNDPVSSIEEAVPLDKSIIDQNDKPDSDVETTPIKIIDVKIHEKTAGTFEKSNEGKSSESIKDISPETPKSQVDIKKRVSEILADFQSNSSVSEKSPRLQNLYVTAYDITSNEDTPESGSPVEEKDSWNSSNFYDHEAEELLRKQLAIEQEIKQLEQQQKEQIPYLFIREIPNKPPPPYKPPVQSQASLVLAVSPEQIESFTPIITEILYKAQVENNLKNIDVCKVNGINNGDKACFEFIFHNCQDIAIKHYDQFEEKSEASWLKVNKSMKFKKPLTKDGLERLLVSQLKQLFGFEKVTLKENTNSRKKRDHVDEVLVIESKIEEPKWTDYDQDELIVKDQVVNEIITYLLNDTINVFREIFAKS